MNPDFINTLEIETVKLYEKTKYVYAFTFKIKNNLKEYMLLLTEDIDGNWDPTDLYQSNDEIECIYCKKSDTEFCDVLGQYVDKIYEKIKEHPNVRLDLLYL